jgi:hypothetical protein
VTTKTTNERLAEYAKLLSEDAGISLLIAVREMCAQADVIAGDLGCTEDEVKDWCGRALAGEVQP